MLCPCTAPECSLEKRPEVVIDGDAIRIGEDENTVLVELIQSGELQRL